MLLRQGIVEDRDEHIDMTPMVDVVFQLMTFMLFSMQLSGDAKVDVPKAIHGVGIEESAVTVISLAPSNSGQSGKALIYLGNGLVDTATNDPKEPVDLEAVKEAINSGLDEGRKRVVIQADGEVGTGDVMDLIAAISEIKGVNIHIGVQEAE